MNLCTQCAHKKCHFIAECACFFAQFPCSSNLFYFFSLCIENMKKKTFSFNDLLIDDTPHSNMNSTRPNESSAEDELDEEGQTDEDNDKQQKLENGANSNDLNNRNIFRTLLKQIHLLHETNSKLFRSLHETKGMWVIFHNI
jgi:hypothetical protein